MPQKMPGSETGFILHGSNRLATVIDLSKLQLPPNARFRYARVTASQEVDHDSFELLGRIGSMRQVDLLPLRSSG
jgi:hypothetical protein